MTEKSAIRILALDDEPFMPELPGRMLVLRRCPAALVV